MQSDAKCQEEKRNDKKRKRKEPAISILETTLTIKAKIRWFVDGKAKGRKGQTISLEVHDEKSRPELVDKFTSQIKRAGQEFRIQISEAIYIYIYIYDV